MRDDKVIANINSPRYRLLRFRNRFLLSHRKKELLQRFSWYRTVTGGWSHPHAMDHMNWLEVRRLTPPQLEYKLQHGSQARLPERLKNGKGG